MAQREAWRLEEIKEDLGLKFIRKMNKFQSHFGIPFSIYILDIYGKALYLSFNGTLVPQIRLKDARYFSLYSLLSICTRKNPLLILIHKA